MTSVTGTAPIVSSGGSTPSISITTPIAASYGGTGIASPTANSLLAGNGSSAVNLIAPSTNGNFLVSNGTSWASRALAYSDIQALARPTQTINYNPAFSLYTTSFVSLGGVRFTVYPTHANAKFLLIGDINFLLHTAMDLAYVDILLNSSTYLSSGTSTGLGLAFAGVSSSGNQYVNAPFSIIFTLPTTTANTLDFMVNTGGGAGGSTIYMMSSTIMEIG